MTDYCVDSLEAEVSRLTKELEATEDKADIDVADARVCLSRAEAEVERIRAAREEDVLTNDRLAAQLADAEARARSSGSSWVHACDELRKADAEVERLKGELAAARWQLEGLCVGIEHAVQDGDTDNAFLLRLASETRANQVRAAPYVPAPAAPAKEETCNQSTSSSSHGSSPASASSPSPLSCPPSCGASTGVEAPAAPYEPTDEEVERAAIELHNEVVNPHTDPWELMPSGLQSILRRKMRAALRAVPPRVVTRTVYRVPPLDEVEDTARRYYETDAPAGFTRSWDAEGNFVKAGTRKVVAGVLRALVAHVGDAGVVDAETVERCITAAESAAKVPVGRGPVLAVIAALGLKVAP